MFDPTEEMGTFIAHCMYQELEKIAKYRVPGSFGLSQIDDLLQYASKLERPGLLLESVEGRARRQSLNTAQKQLNEIRERALRQSRSSDPALRQEALDALNQTQMMNLKIKSLKGPAKKSKPPANNIVPESVPAAPTAATPPKPSKPGALVRVRNTVGNAALGLGGTGAAYYGYTKLRPSDPYSQY